MDSRVNFEAIDPVTKNFVPIPVNKARKSKPRSFGYFDFMAIYLVGAKSGILVWRVKVKLSSSESQFKKNSKCYIHVFVHWFNQCNSY